MLGLDDGLDSFGLGRGMEWAKRCAVVPCGTLVAGDLCVGVEAKHACLATGNWLRVDIDRVCCNVKAVLEAVRPLKPERRVAGAIVVGHTVRWYEIDAPTMRIFRCAFFFSPRTLLGLR